MIGIRSNVHAARDNQNPLSSTIPTYSTFRADHQ